MPLRAVGIDVYQIDHEDANGQFEVNFTYGDALSTADRLIFVKMAASEIANQMGMIATFMPKPFSNRTGNRRRTFTSRSATPKSRTCSTTTRTRTGLGCRRWATSSWAACWRMREALTAICAPTINSYKRLVVGRALSGATWAPAYITYGDNNRTCMVRVPYGRLETAAARRLLQSLSRQRCDSRGRHGRRRRKARPGQTEQHQPLRMEQEKLKKAGIGLLPQNLNEALDAFEKDEGIAQRHR